MQTTYILRKDKKNKDGTIPIRAVITFQGARIRKNIKSVKTTEKHWKNQRIKQNTKSEEYNNHIEYNLILDEFQEKVNAIFRYIHLHNISVSEEYVLNKLADKHFGKNSLAPNFFTCFDEFIETSKTTKVLGTIKKYTTVTNFLKAFQDSTGYSIRFDTIDIDFYEKFRDYSFLQRNTLNNYFGKLVSIIKTFMTWSLERGYHENLTYKRFKKPQDDIEVIYLTIDELMKLYKHEFKSRKLEHVRDFYCLGCFTGLRFSDIKKLTPSNVFDNHLKVNIVKTRTIDQKIPLNKYSKSILDKYVDTIYEPIPTLSSQKFNEYIKDCCEMVGIKTLTTITRYIGQKRIDKTYPKFKLITSHTARKTFVTNSLVLGMKAMVVRNITGHKDEASFRRYVDIAEDFKRQEMDNTWDKMGTSA